MYNIRIDTDAKQDIQSAIDWYDEQDAGLSDIFEQEVKQHISTLISIPFFQKRYH